MAGTRQREAFFTAMENWNKVTDLATISTNALGSAEEKMAAYSDSLQAAQNRVTAAFEKWVLAANGNEFLIGLNNLIATLIENLDVAAISLAALITVTQGKKLTNLGLEGFFNLGNKLMNIGSVKSSISTLNTKGIFGSWKNKAEELTYVNATKTLDLLVAKMSTMGKVVDENTVNMIKNGQAILLETSATKKSEAMTLLETWASQGALSVTEAETLAKQLGITETNKASQAVSLFTSNIDEATRKLIVQNVKNSTENSSKQALTSIGRGISTIGAGISGMYVGSYLGEKIGGDAGSIAGSVIGTGIMGGLSKLLSSFGPWGIFGSIALQIGSSFITGIFKSRDKAKEEAVKLATETAAEAEDAYKNAITSTSQVERYDELAKGVDSLGRNVSLTNDEYQEFLDTSNSLAEIFPELVVRTDDMGNSLLGVDGKVGQITDSVNELTLALQKAYNQSLIDPNFAGQSLEEAQKTYLDAQKKIDEANKEIEKLKNEISGYNKTVSGNFESDLATNVYDELGIPLALDTVEYAAINVGNSNLVETFAKELEDSGIMEYGGARVNSALDSYIFVDLADQEKALKLINSYWKENKESVSDYSAEINRANSDIVRLNEVIQEQIKIQNEARDSMESFYTAQAQRVIGEGVWNAYTEEQQQALITAVGSVSLFNPDKTEKEFDEYQEEIEELADNIQKIFANPENASIINLIYGDNKQKTLKEVEEASKTYATQIAKVMDDSGNTEVEINEVLNKLGFRFTKFYGEDWGKIQSIGDNIRDQLIEKGLSKNVASQLDNTEIEILEYAFKNLDKTILSSIDTLDDFYEEVNSDKLNQDNLAYFVAEYEKLEDLGISPDDNSSNGRYMKQLVDRITEYATQVGAAKDDWAEILRLAKQMSETDLFGTSSLTPTEVNDKYSNYQSYLNYLQNDFNGTWDASQLATMMEQSPELLPYLNDVEALKNKLIEFASSGEEEFNNSIQRMIVESEEGTKAFLDSNQEWVKDVKEDYGINLNDFATLEAAKYAIDLALNGDMDGVWDTWVSEMSDKYDQDFSNFTTRASQKIAILSAIAKEMGKMTMEEWMQDRGFSPASGYTTDELTIMYEQEMGLSSPDSWNIGESINESITGALNSVLLDIENIGGSSSSGSGGSGSTLEDLLNAYKDAINKEYEAMITFDEKNLKQVKPTEYYNKMANILQKQLDYYNSQLKVASSEEEQLEILTKIQDVKVEIANLDDERLEDELSLAQAKELSLGSQIEIQKELLKASDTEEEMVQRQSELNDLLKQEYELRQSINSFQMDMLQRQIDRTDPNSALYDQLVEQQIKEANDSAQLAYNAWLKERARLNAIYSSEKNSDGTAKYSNKEIQDMIDGSEEVQNLYQTYLDNMDKALEIALNSADAKLEKIDAKINELDLMKPKEWSSIEQIIKFSDNNLDLLKSKIPILEEALSHSAEMTNEQIQNYVDELNDVYNAIREAEIQKQQDIVDYHDKVYDALTWQVQEYIDEIEKQKEAVEDYYDTEIDKLEKVNKAKERTIELEKLQDALMNARKNKQRVNLNMPSIKIAI